MHGRVEQVSDYSAGSHGSFARTQHVMRADASSENSAHDVDPSLLPLHWRQAVDDADVPSSAFFDYPCPVGPPPSARWGHACAAVGDRSFVFGGESATGLQCNAFVFDAGRRLLP